MPRGDAVQQQPTIEQEMAKFKGFSTTDGEVSQGGTTPEEQAALDRRAAAEQQSAAAAAQNANAQAAHSAQQQQATAEGAEKTGAGDGTKREPKHYTDLKGVSYDDLQEDDLIPVREARKMASHRVNTMRRQAGGVERENAALRARLDALEQRVNTSSQAGLTTGQAGATKDKSAPPNPADYQYGTLDDRYIDDLTTYKARQAVTQAQQSQQTERQSADQRQQAEALQQRVDDFGEKGAEKFDDFYETVIEGARAGDWPLSPIVGELALESEHGPDIAYHLATHVGEARKVAKMNPSQQRLWFARQEAQLSAAQQAAADQQGQQGAQQGQQAAAGTAPTQVRTTKAPAPPQFKARGQGAATPVDGTTADFAAFERMAMGGNK